MMDGGMAMNGMGGMGGMGGGAAGGRPSAAHDAHAPLPALNSIHQGRVASLQKYGCFVEIDGFPRHGLVHISRLASRRVESPDEVVSAGERVYVKVVELKEQPGRPTQISLSMKEVSQEEGEDLDPDHSGGGRGGEGGSGGGGGGGRSSDTRASLPALDSIHKGRVASLQTYGCFVEIDGFSGNGLVHISCLASRRVENPADVVSAGDRVWVKVMELKEQPGRPTQISLSMKDVSQEDGTDFEQYKQSQRAPMRGPLDQQDGRGGGGEYGNVEEEEEGEDDGTEVVAPMDARGRVLRSLEEAKEAPLEREDMKSRKGTKKMNPNLRDGDGERTGYEEESIFQHSVYHGIQFI